ncbi:MAG: polyprenyl synthetase family protein [Bacteroidetes bacterium]|jgi:geranylgeranyl diphosphate synthase type II|nr:polyprenyl synthetase family protein [Bacteroidota bacterium]MBK9319978.1 polyprenyl synthetase family protein [Bacteroidota bacterium]
MDPVIVGLQDRIEEYLKKLDIPVQPLSLYEPVRYMLSLGGKRMRPVLVLLANKMFNGKAEVAFPAAAGIEVFHNFTLLHDDIMDNAPLRRGKPTVHEKWNANIAILSGDAMFVKSCQLMMQSPISAMPAVMNLFLKTALEVCEGQQMDMDFEKEENVSIENYLEMIRLKTAVLLGAGLGIGAAIAGAAPSEVNHLYDFGVNLGVAFQLQDDILDVYGDAAKFGKQVGGDILSNKKTFLLLTAINLATADVQSDLNYWLDYSGSDTHEKVKSMTAIYDKLNVRDVAETKMDQLYMDALAHLDALPLTIDQTRSLRDLAAMLMERES